MKVHVAGTDQVVDVDGKLSVGDILIFTSTMAIVRIENNEAESVMVASTVSGIKTSELFGKIQMIEGKEIETEKDDE